eukprot:Ihof_evm2s924 gene=Ihof_evmTU2s924
MAQETEMVPLQPPPISMSTVEHSYGVGVGTAVINMYDYPQAVLKSYNNNGKSQCELSETNLTQQQT